MQLESLDEGAFSLWHGVLSDRDMLSIGVYTFILSHLSWASTAWAHQLATEETVLLVVERIGRAGSLLYRLEHVLRHRCNRLRDCADLTEQVFVSHSGRRLVTLGRREATAGMAAGTRRTG